MPDVISCKPWENGCQWIYTVTFVEENGVSATITELCRKYTDTKGGVWTSSGGSGCFDKTIEISPGGSEKYTSWVRTQPGGSPSLSGGTVTIKYRGKDARDNAFSGSVSAKLDLYP
jgi:hypothetical protein